MQAAVGRTYLGRLSRLRVRGYDKSQNCSGLVSDGAVGLG